jgi:hypothetical protein
MKKIFTLLISTFLLVGCAETMVLLGPASSIIGGGNVVQSSVSSAINYGVKKQTGKSPMQHALAYAEEKNPNKEKKRCISFIEKTNSEACAIAKKQVALAKIKVKKKVKNIFKDIPLIDKSTASEKLFRTTISSRGQAFAKARKKGKDSFIFNGKIYNTKLKDVVTEKIIKSHDLVSLKNKEKNNLIKSKKSTIEQAFDVQAALNKRN